MPRAARLRATADGRGAVTEEDITAARRAAAAARGRGRGRGRGGRGAAALSERPGLELELGAHFAVGGCLPACLLPGGLLLLALGVLLGPAVPNARKGRAAAGPAHAPSPANLPARASCPPPWQISEWYVEVDEVGNPLVRPEDAAEDEAEVAANMRSLSRRDAAGFIRAVRRYGLLSKMADISAEVGQGPAGACGTGETCRGAAPAALRVSVG
jgi:hypothetical protein